MTRLSIAGTLIVLFHAFCVSWAQEEDEETLRAKAKPWYNRKIEVAGITLPMTPITFFTLTVSILYLRSNWSQGSKHCVASHILIMEHTEEAKAKLEEYKKAIGNDEALFAKHAKKYSACPSKNQGGNLGKFKPFAMAPPFDKACFDPKSPVKETIGPIHTTFGWHLIYIHERKLD